MLVFSCNSLALFKMKKTEMYRDNMGYLCCTPPYGMLITAMSFVERKARPKKYKFRMKVNDNDMIELRKKGLTQKEIAIKLDISLGTVKTRWRSLRARALL